MSTAEEIKKELEEIERKECALLEDLANYKATHGSEYFRPWAHQRTVLDLIERGKKTVVLHGANKTGKTTLGANVVCTWVMGYQPWDRRPSIFGGRPTRIRILCTDWEHHAKEVIVPALKEWIPSDAYYEPKKNNVGIEAYWYFKNGSSLELLTQIMDTRSHEGWTGDGIWQDEEGSRDKYTANKRGLIPRNGVYLITLTEVEKEGWILDDLILSNDPSIGYVTDIPMSANPLLSKEAIENFKRACTSEEIEARVYGKLIKLVGRICKEFDRDRNIIEPFEVPRDWPVVAMIDLHPAKPQALGFYACDERGNHYNIDEKYEHFSPEEVGHWIIGRKLDRRWRMKEAYIDPLAKGDSAYMRNRFDVEDSYTIIERILQKEGIRLEVASKDKDSGIRNIRKWLMGPNKVPCLFFFNTCERHIWEIQRWRWNEGKAAKEDDDMMENLYRYTLVGNKYRELQTKPLRRVNYSYA